MASHSKLVTIIKSYIEKERVNVEQLSKEYAHSEEKKNITLATIESELTLLRNSNVVKSSHKGINFFNPKLLSRTYYNNDEYSAQVIASIINRVKDKPYPVLKYIFTDVPKLIVKSLSKKYSTTFNKTIIDLLDTKKYYYFHQFTDPNDTYQYVIMPMRV